MLNSYLTQETGYTTITRNLCLTKTQFALREGLVCGQKVEWKLGIHKSLSQAGAAGEIASRCEAKLKERGFEA